MTGFAALAVILAGSFLHAESGPTLRSYTSAEKGIRFAVPAEGYVVREKAFELGWPGALFEFQSGDGEVGGFLNTYAMGAVQEDKATLCGAMVVRPGAVARRAASDPVLANKVARMKELLRSFCAQIDESFWKARESRLCAPSK